MATAGSPTASLEENLAARHRIEGTILVTKPDSSFPAAPDDIEMLAADATAIIAAIGD